MDYKEVIDNLWDLTDYERGIGWKEIDAVHIAIEACEKQMALDPVFNESSEVKNLIFSSKTDIDQAILKLVEELGELVSARKALTSYKNGTIDHVSEEAVDVLQCAMSIYFLIQAQQPFDGAGIMKEKNSKWAMKYIEGSKQCTQNA